MVCKDRIVLAVGIGLSVLASTVGAQDQQWLQYHCAREVGLLGGAQSRSLEIGTEKPSGVELPQFKTEKPFFAKWSSPMVKGGCLWIALDRTHKQGPHDLLYIDSNGNGRLDDETAVAAYRMGQYTAYFGPVKVIFDLQDGPVTYHLNFLYYGYDDRNRRLYVSAGGWYQGEVTVDGQKKHCVLFDNNANGTFNDKSANAPECDRIRIGSEGNQETSFVGNYVEVDGVLYRPEIACDGACIKLTKAEDVKFGNVRLPEGITQISANGENGLFVRTIESGIASLPVGRYGVYEWDLERKDDKGARWRLQASATAAKNAFDVTEGNETVLSVGEPVIATLDASQRAGTYAFRYTLRGRDGERIELTRDGAQPQAPRVHIRSADGKYDRTESFAYG